MISLSLATALYVYLTFLCIFSIFFLIIFYNIIHTGELTLVSFLMTFLVIAMTIYVLWATWNLLQGVDWQQPLILFKEKLPFPFGS